MTPVLTSDWSAAGGGWGLLVQARVADPGGHQQDKEEGGQLPVARNGFVIVNNRYCLLLDYFVGETQEEVRGSEAKCQEHLLDKNIH